MSAEIEKGNNDKVIELSEKMSTNYDKLIDLFRTALSKSRASPEPLISPGVKSIIDSDMKESGTQHNVQLDDPEAMRNFQTNMG